MVSVRIYFEHRDPSKLTGINYDSTEFDLDKSIFEDVFDAFDPFKTITDLMNPWTDFVLENDFDNPQITEIEEVPYDGEEE